MDEEIEKEERHGIETRTILSNRSTSKLAEVRIFMETGILLLELER